MSATGRRAAIAALPKYHPDRPPVRIDLSDNTSLWGPPPSARATLATLTDAHLSRYPTPYADALTAALAAHHHIAPERIVNGCGSDDVLDSAIRACCDAGSTMAMAVPTFSVVPTFAALNEVRVKPVELRRDGSISPAELLATDADLYYLCSPNNPTGTTLSDDVLSELLSSTRAIVVLDEAYADFAGRDALSLTTRFDNLVVLRTLSKAFGLAGIRVGYAIGAPSVISSIALSRGPYKVGALAEAVAIAALANDTAWAADRIAEVRALRDAFAERLHDHGFVTTRSVANFVSVLVEDATLVVARMRERGVLARAYPALPVFGDLVRITIGPAGLLDEAFDALVAATR